MSPKITWEKNSTCLEIQCPFPLSLCCFVHSVRRNVISTKEAQTAVTDTVSHMVKFPCVFEYLSVGPGIALMMSSCGGRISTGVSAAVICCLPPDGDCDSLNQSSRSACKSIHRKSVISQIKKNWIQRMIALFYFHTSSIRDFQHRARCHCGRKFHCSDALLMPAAEALISLKGHPKGLIKFSDLWFLTQKVINYSKWWREMK